MNTNIAAFYTLSEIFVISLKENLGTLLGKSVQE